MKEPQDAKIESPQKDVKLAKSGSTFCKSYKRERMPQERQINFKGEQNKTFSVCTESYRCIMGRGPEGQDAHLNDCQIHKPDSLRGSCWIKKAVDYIKSLLKPLLLHATPSVETI